MFISIIIKLNSINAMWNRITSMVILILLLNFLWQFMIFLRTDLYLVLLTYFDMSSLYDYSKIYIKNSSSSSSISRGHFYPTTTKNKRKSYLLSLSLSVPQVSIVLNAEWGLCWITF